MSEFLPPEQDVTESSQSRRMLAWLRGTQRGFGPPDRWATRAVLAVLVVDILFGNLGGAFLDQYVRNVVGWGYAVEKSPHEHTSLSEEDYEGLTRRWKQVLAEALTHGDHMPVAVDLLSWIGADEINAIGKIAPLVLNNRAVYAESVSEISELSGVAVREISRLRKIGFIDEGPGPMLDVWRDDGTGEEIIAGNNVALLCWKDAGGFSLSRMTLTPVGAYIVMLLDPVTDPTYLQRVADRIDKQGAEVEWVYGDVEFDGGGGVFLDPKLKAPWKQFETKGAEDQT